MSSEKPRGEGMLMVTLVERSPQEAAAAKRARRAARKSASSYAMERGA